MVTTRTKKINNVVLADILNRYDQDGSVSGMLNTFIRKIFYNKPHMELREGLLKSLLRLPVNEKNSLWLAMLDNYIGFLIKDGTKRHLCLVFRLYKKGTI